MRNLAGEIDWSLADSFIEREGMYVFGGIDENSLPTNDLFLIWVDQSGKHHLESP